MARGINGRSVWGFFCLSACLSVCPSEWMDYIGFDTFWFLFSFHSQPDTDILMCVSNPSLSGHYYAADRSTPARTTPVSALLKYFCCWLQCHSDLYPPWIRKQFVNQFFLRVRHFEDLPLPLKINFPAEEIYLYFIHDYNPLKVLVDLTSQNEFSLQWEIFPLCKLETLVNKLLDKVIALSFCC